jgi:hypothetical protein
MVQDSQLMRAVSGILQRSERQQNLQKLVGAFVDVGIMSQIQNTNNQVIYGRRGTGKTHVLRVLGSNLQSVKNVVVYVDARMLGSTSQFSDNSVPLPARCTALFRDFLGEIHNALLDHIVTLAPPTADVALDELNELGKVATELFTTVVAEKATGRLLQKRAEESSLGASLVAAPIPHANLGVSAGTGQAMEAESSTDYTVLREDKIPFPAVTTRVKSVLKSCDAQLFVLVDEWSSLPTDVQPYLAEFFKRAFFALPQVTVKIASLEHRSVFSVQGPHGVVGFELGADISAGIDIDDYYVFDRNPDRITDAFGDMLVKHIRNEVQPGYLEDQLGIHSGQELASKLFTERAVFQELVRASEGVARDLINIFSLAYFSAHRKGKEKIERGAVLEGARQWFEQDKEGNLDEHLRDVLRRITDEVIGNRRARSFLLPRELGDHPVIQRLFDLRVLHLVQRGYADKDTPGVRYNIYSLDYGTYVDLMNTSKKPDVGFTVSETKQPEDFVVPFDDKRSIRRIILTQKILSSESAAEAGAQ